MKKLALVVTLCLAFAACGDDKDPGKAFEDATGGSAEDILKTGGKIELTDEMMERYVKLVKELKGLDGRPGAALLARYHFDLKQWLGVSMIIGSSAARSAMSGIRPKLEEQLKVLKEKLSTASEDQKAMYEAQIEGLEAQLESLGDYGEANEIDKHNMEVIERWKDRIEAAGR